MLQGVVREHIAAADGRQITLRYGRPGELLGGWRAGGVPMSGGTQALTQSRLLHVAAGEFQSIIKEDPRLSLALLDELQDRLDRVEHVLAVRAFSRVRGRVARDILDRAMVGMHMDEPIRVSYQELAEAIGSVRDVVARSVRELARAGLIAVGPAGIVVTDAARLEQESLQWLS